MPYSPPRRPSVASLDTSSADRVPGAPEPGKDEFGRDIRPPSQERDSLSAVEDSRIPPPPPPLQVAPVAAIKDVGPALKSNQVPVSPSETTSLQAPNTVVSSVTTPLPLNNFDMTTFDFTSPASWEALGKMWEATHGYMPSQEELMQFVFSGGMVGPNIHDQMNPQRGWSEPSWAGNSSERSSGQPWQGGGRGGLQRGGQGSGYGYNSRPVVGGQEENSTELPHADSNGIAAPGGSDIQTTSPETPAAGRLGGKMQRVGDRWVFVRDTPSGTS
jgi:protein NRD1